MSLPILGRLGIGGKLIVGFTASTLLTLMLGGYALYGMADMDAASAVIRDDYLPSITMVGRLTSTLERYRAQQARLLMDSALPDHHEATDLFKEAGTALDKERADYESHIDAGWERENMTRFDRTLSEYRQTVDAPLQRMESAGDLKGAHVMFVDSLSKFNDLRGIANADVDYNQRSGQQATQSSNATYVRTRDLTLAALAVSAIASLIVAWMLMRDIARPLVGMRACMDRLAAGDLSIDVPGAGRSDEGGGF